MPRTHLFLCRRFGLCCVSPVVCMIDRTQDNKVKTYEGLQGPGDLIFVPGDSTAACMLGRHFDTPLQHQLLCRTGGMVFSTWRCCKNMSMLCKLDLHSVVADGVK